MTTYLEAKIEAIRNLTGEDFDRGTQATLDIVWDVQDGHSQEFLTVDWDGVIDSETGEFCYENLGNIKENEIEALKDRETE